MAFTLGSWIRSHLHPFPSGLSDGHFELADQFATTGSQPVSWGGITWARAVVRQKGWGSGTGTVGPIYSLQLAYDSAFTSQVRTLDQAQTQRNTVDQSFLLNGVDAVEQNNSFVRVAMTFSGTDVVTADIMIDVLP